MEPTSISTIPKSVTGREELVVLPRREFERMFKKIQDKFRSEGRIAPRIHYIKGKLERKILW